MASPPVLSFSLPRNSTRISLASNSSWAVTINSPVIVSPRQKVSLLMFSVTDAFGALKDLNSGKNGMPLFLELYVCGLDKNVLLLTNSDCLSSGFPVKHVLRCFPQRSL